MEDCRPYFLLYGDSITQQGFNPKVSGWVAELADQYQQKVDIINRGHSGYTSRWALGLLPVMLPLREGGHHPSIVMIFFGANDSCLPGSSQHVPVDEYKHNMKKIIRYMKATVRAPHVIVIGPPPIDAEHWKNHKKLPVADRAFENTKLYANAAQEAAHEEHAFHLDLFNSMAAQPNWKTMLFDGLHFGEAGHKHLSAALTALIAEKLPQLTPASIAFPVPYWADIKEDTFKHLRPAGM